MHQVDFTKYKDLNWVIAFSGGADSRLLLELCAENRKLAKSIKAVYVHHHLQEIADSWVDFCKSVCEKLSIPYFVEHVKVKEEGSIEANAREARYKALAKYIDNKDCVLFTAHHADDLLESMILALTRGSGISGLTSMPPERPFACGILARPLFSLSRKDIENECSKRNITYVTDPTNLMDNYDRNFIRLHVAPLLKERFSNILDGILLVNENLSNQKSVYYSLLSEKLKQIIDNSLIISGVNANKLENFDEGLRAELIRYYFKLNYDLNLNKTAISEILSLNKLSSDNKAIIKSSNKWGISIYKGIIYPSPLNITFNDEYELNLGEKLKVGNIVYYLEKVSPLKELGNQENPHEGLSKNSSQNFSQNSLEIWGKSLFNQVNTNAQTNLEGNDETSNPNMHSLDFIYLSEDDKVSLKFNLPSSLRIKPQNRVHSQILKNLWKEYSIPLYLRAFSPLVSINNEAALLYKVFRVGDTFNPLEEKAKGKDAYILRCEILN